MQTHAHQQCNKKSRAGPTNCCILVFAYNIGLSVLKLKLLLQPTAEAMTLVAAQVLTIKIVVIKGDAVGGWALVHPKVHVLALPFMVSVEMPQGSMGLILAQLASLIKLAIFHHFAHLHDMYCQPHNYVCLHMFSQYSVFSHKLASEIMECVICIPRC